MSPTANKFEVEVKTLLGEQAQVDKFLAALKQRDPELKQFNAAKQLNHYFDDQGDEAKLLSAVASYLTDDDLRGFKGIVTASKRFALRTRDQDGEVLLVIKAAKGDGDEQHALERLEGEYPTTVANIDELDEAIRGAGYDFLSKWSRERTEYNYRDFTVCIDKNAGYGFVAEIEKVVDSESVATEAREEILTELAELGFEELSQERVGRMFEHYNQHWREYYRTEKTFTVE